MNGLYRVLMPLHVSADLVWIGSILSVGVVMTGTADAKARGMLARSIYLKLSTPAFGLAFILGAILLLLSPHYYFVETKFMHAKLTLAVVVIALHHVIGARARKMAAGDSETPGPTVLLQTVIAVAAVSIVFLSLLKPF